MNKILLYIALISIIFPVSRIYSADTSSLILPSVEIKGVNSTQYDPNIGRKYNDTQLSDIEQSFVDKNEEKIEYIRKMNDALYRKSLLSLHGRQLPGAKEKNYIASLKFFLNSNFYPNYELLGGYNYINRHFLIRIKADKGNQLSISAPNYLFSDQNYKSTNFLATYAQDLKGNSKFSAEYTDFQQSSLTKVSGLQQNAAKDALKLSYFHPTDYGVNLSGQADVQHYGIERPAAAKYAQDFMYYRLLLKLSNKYERSRYDVSVKTVSSAGKNYYAAAGAFKLKPFPSMDKFLLNSKLDVLYVNDYGYINPLLNFSYSGTGYVANVTMKSAQTVSDADNQASPFLNDYTNFIVDALAFSSIFNLKVNIWSPFVFSSSITYNQYANASYFEENGITHFLEDKSISDFSQTLLYMKLYYKISSYSNFSVSYNQTIAAGKVIPYEPNFKLTSALELRLGGKFTENLNAVYMGQRYKAIDKSNLLNDMLLLNNRLKYGITDTLSVNLELAYNVLAVRVYDNYKYPRENYKLGVSYKF